MTGTYELETPDTRVISLISCKAQDKAAGEGADRTEY